MHVIATAGHVDHGKSTLVRALTGSDPDRLEEEHARGLSIELGYCWTDLPHVGEVAFVDVPGHERFITTMLSGVGPVPAVMLVVAADDPWMPQAAEHLAALDALGVLHGVVAVTRSDLADPGPAVERVHAELAGTSLEQSPVVPVSAVTGAGLDELRARLVEMVRRLPEPDPRSAVRLWLDRCFHVKGAGTVVTGTLPAGRIRVGDALAVGSHVVRVRGLQALGRGVGSVDGVARVALNVAGGVRAELSRHSVLTTPGAWLFTDVVDVRLGDEAAPTRREGRKGPPERPVLHLGATAVSGHFRPLGGEVARLTLERALPLRVGDRALLRDPGSRSIWGVTVLDPTPPRLDRRGAARSRAEALAGHDGTADLHDEVERRKVVSVDLLVRIGVSLSPDEVAEATPDGWLVSKTEADRLRAELEAAVREQELAGRSGLAPAALADRLGLPSAHLVTALVRPPLRVLEGLVTTREHASDAALPDDLERSVRAIEADLARNPFAAPSADRLRELGLSAKGVSAAVRTGRLLHVGDGIVLLPGADDEAVRRLAELPSPFTTSQARERLETSRRVVLPLLAHLDRRGRTRRLPDDRRTVVTRG